MGKHWRNCKADMAKIRLKSGKECSIMHEAVKIGDTELSHEEMALICRAFLTEIPLKGEADVRLKLIDEIRTSTIKEVKHSPVKRWIVLNATSLFSGDGNGKNNPRHEAILNKA